MVNHILWIENITVTLQWPREAGAVYHVSVSPETPHSELITSGHILMMNLIFSYNIQYNVSIVSSLCGVTTTKLLNYGKHKLYYNGYTHTVNSLLADAPNSGLTRYSGHCSMHGLISLLLLYKKTPE